MNRLKTTGVVGGAAAWTVGWRSGARSENSRKRGYQRAFAAITAIAVVMSLMVVLASPALAHHPILSVSAVCDDQGNKVVTWTVANGNWEGRTMTVDLVEYTDGTSGWSSIVVGLTLGPDESASQSITYPLSEIGTKTLTVRADWNGGSQDVSASLSTKLKDLKCKDTTTTTVKDHDTTTTTVKDHDTTTTTVKDHDTTTTTVKDHDTTTSSSTTSSSSTSSSSTSPSSTIVTGVPTTEPNVTGSTVDDQVQGTVITTSSTVADEVDAVEILPFTGSNADALLVLALSAVALGGILVMSARREEG